MLDYQSIRSTCCRDEQVHARGSHRYFRSGAGQGNWVFTATSRYNRGRVVRHELFRASRIPIHRHVKIRAEATVFDPAYREYFSQRWLKMLSRRSRQRLAVAVW